jgi:hypothetical protein
LLHQFVILLLGASVGTVGGAVMKAGQHEEAAGCTAGLAHPTDASAKRGGHAQGLFGSETVEVGIGGDYGLGAVESFLKEGYRFGDSFLVCHLDFY